MGVKHFDVMSLGKVGLIDPEQLGYHDSIEIIKDESLKVQKSFVKIGWYLKHIRDNELYKENGYDSVWECAADQLGYSQSTASRFINICEKFSKDHNSPELDTKYAGFDKSQMIEMLPMEPEQLDKVTPDMTVKQIRDIKSENKVKVSKEEPVQVVDDNIPGQTSIENDFPEYLPDEQPVVQDEVEAKFYATSHKENDLCPPSASSCVRQEWGTTLEQQEAGKKECEKCWEHHKKLSSTGSLEQVENEKIENDDMCSEENDVIDGEYREVRESEPAEEAIATSQSSGTDKEETHDKNWFTRQYVKTFPEEASKLFEICGAEQNNSDRAKAIQKHIAPYGFHSNSCSEYDFTFRGFAAGMDFRIGDEKMHLKYGAFVVELMKILNGDDQQKEKVEEASEKTIKDGLATTKYILEQEKKTLDDMLKFDDLPEMTVLKQKIIVAALAAMVCDLENVVPELDPQLEMSRMDDITTEMAELVCDRLCKYPENLSAEELEEKCSVCEMGDHICHILNEYNRAVESKADHVFKKATPEKVKHEKGFYYCPECENVLNNDDGELYCHCPKCGKALIW